MVSLTIESRLMDGVVKCKLYTGPLFFFSSVMVHGSWLRDFFFYLTVIEHMISFCNMISLFIWMSKLYAV